MKIASKQDSPGEAGRKKKHWTQTLGLPPARVGPGRPREALKAQSFVSGPGSPADSQLSWKGREIVPIAVDWKNNNGRVDVTTIVSTEVILGGFRKIVHSKTFPSPDSLLQKHGGTTGSALHGCPAHKEHEHRGPQEPPCANTYFLRLSWKPQIGSVFRAFKVPPQ